MLIIAGIVALFLFPSISTDSALVATCKVKKDDNIILKANPYYDDDTQIGEFPFPEVEDKDDQTREILYDDTIHQYDVFGAVSCYTLLQRDSRYCVCTNEYTKRDGTTEITCDNLDEISPCLAMHYTKPTLTKVKVSAYDGASFKKIEYPKPDEPQSYNKYKDLDPKTSNELEIEKSVFVDFTTPENLTISELAFYSKDANKFIVPDLPIFNVKVDFSYAHLEKSLDLLIFKVTFNPEACYFKGMNHTETNVIMMKNTKFEKQDGMVSTMIECYLKTEKLDYDTWRNLDDDADEIAILKKNFLSSSIKSIDFMFASCGKQDEVYEDALRIDLLGAYGGVTQQAYNKFLSDNNNNTLNNYENHKIYAAYDLSMDDNETLLSQFEEISECSGNSSDPCKKKKCDETHNTLSTIQNLSVCKSKSICGNSLSSCDRADNSSCCEIREGKTCDEFQRTVVPDTTNKCNPKREGKCFTTIDNILDDNNGTPMFTRKFYQIVNDEKSIVRDGRNIVKLAIEPTNAIQSVSC